MGLRGTRGGRMLRGFRVLLTEEIDGAGLEILRGLCEVRFATGVSEETLMREGRDVDALVIRAAGRITAKIMDGAPGLRVVARHGAGYDNIDVEAATERGIVVVYSPGTHSATVADHTLGLMIAVAKRIPQAHDALRLEGRWQVRKEYIGTDVTGKTLGIVGLGRIGREVAKRARGFDMKVLCYDPYVEKKRAGEVGAEPVDLETLLRESDFVTLHVPITRETCGLIGERQLSLMKPGAYLINTCRGAVVDEKALVKALTSGRLAGAALDVFDKEPPDPANPLFKLDNVVVTPHMAAHTREALQRMAVSVAEDVVRVLRGERPINAANPRVLECPSRTRPARSLRS